MIAFEIRLDIRGGNSFRRLGFMVHEEGVRKYHSPIVGCIIDDFHIQLFAQIFGQIRLILLHIGKPQALSGVWKANVGKSAIAIPGNHLTRLGFHDIYICFVWIFGTAKLEADPAAAAQLEGAGPKHAGRSLVMFPAI
ncbi:hypothetical protein D3C75_651870 [compost metagenome]